MQSTLSIRVTVRGRLSERLAPAFEGMTVVPRAGATDLVGDVVDQARLYGLLTRIRDLGLELESVHIAGADHDVTSERSLEMAAVAATGPARSAGCELYHEQAGEGVPILLVHPAGATAATWGAATVELARIGRVITYDRRGYARSGGELVRTMSTHTSDAAALLSHLRTAPAVVVGTSAGAAIAVDLAVRRPDLVRVVVAHEFPWRFTRHVPSASQVVALARIGALAVRGRHGDAAEVLLRAAYAYRDGRSAWDAFPEEWRRAGRENARAALADFRSSIVTYPSARELAGIRVPVVCSYGARSPDGMVRLVRSLAAAIPTARAHRVEGAGHAAPFDAPAGFARLVAEAVASTARRP